MIKKTFVAVSSIVLLSACSVGIAQAAPTPTATVGGVCAKAGATTTISGKSYTCVKVLSGKLVWTTTPTSTTIGGSKPSIAGGGGDGPDGPGLEGGQGGPGDDHGARDAGRLAAFKKYNACLVSHGGVAIAVPKRGPGAPSAQPSLTAAQSKAVAACTALAPKLPPRGDN